MRGVYAALLALIVAPAAQAYTIAMETFLGFPDISYSGQAIYNNGVGSYAGPIYRAPGLQRVDYFWHGRDVSAVADWQAQEVFAIDAFGVNGTYDFADPYLQRIFPIVTEFPGFSAQQASEGETANGVVTTRYAVEGIGMDGQAFTGNIWVADTGAVIMARIDYGDLNVTYDLYDYAPGPQDPAMFDLTRDEDAA